jgi:exopolysaccharide biosynthesis polyprenyl glycosylphosphotransferase
VTRPDDAPAASLRQSPAAAPVAAGAPSFGAAPAQVAAAPSVVGVSVDRNRVNGEAAPSARRGAVERAARRRGWFLMVADVIGIACAYAMAWWLRYEAGAGGPVAPYNYVPFSEYGPPGIVLIVVLVFIYRMEGLYSPHGRVSFLDSLYSLITGTIVGVALLALAMFATRPLAQSRLMLTFAGVLIVLTLSLIRVASVQLERRRLARGEGVARTIMVGAGETARAVMRNIVADPYSGLSIVGFLDDDPVKNSAAIGRFEPLGPASTERLEALIDGGDIDDVIITLPWVCRDKIVSLVESCERHGVRARIVPDMFQMSLNRVDLESLNGIPLIGVRESSIEGWQYRLKRGLDLLLAATFLVLFSWFLVLIAAAVKVNSRGPVLFRQKRVGRDGRPFILYKFRSMHIGADERHEDMAAHNEATGPIFKMKVDPRVTGVGRLLRRTSLDELPQLWNVLRGEMSMVGPRPPMPNEVRQYKDWHTSRLEVSPGMTGLWQVSGRSDLTFDEMVMLDLFYAENWSLGLDVRILLRTVPTVLLGRGAY